MDWLSFLNSHNITYTHNRNRREVDIECPFCNDTDHSQHLGISLVGNGWHCWKDELHHSGKSNIRLIVALIGCSYEQAKIYADQGEVSFRTTDATFAQDLFRVMGVPVKPTGVQVITKLKFLTDFKPINTSGLCGEVIVPYLIKNRRYGSKTNVMKLVDRFGLMYTLSGAFSYRIIIPVIINKEVVTWTGRTVVHDEQLRYLSLSDSYEIAKKWNLPVATKNIKDCILDYDNLKKGGEVLVICEGPFDAMRVTYFGEEYGILGTCLFNASIRSTQLELLLSVADYFKEVVLMFDRLGTIRHTISFPDLLSARPLFLPDNTKDPAELDLLEFKALFKI